MSMSGALQTNTKTGHFLKCGKKYIAMLFLPQSGKKPDDMNLFLPIKIGDIAAKSRQTIKTEFPFYHRQNSKR